MTVLVLGAGGMVGSAVVREAVRDGLDVHAVLRRETSPERFAEVEEGVGVHRQSLDDAAAVAALVERCAPEVIVHAAFPGGHPRDSASRGIFLERALRVATGVFEALRRTRFPGRLVLLGSGMSYGATGEPHHPSDPLRPSTFRGAVKAAESLLASRFASETGCRLTELRIFTAYGPWEQHGKLLPTLLAAALTNRTVPLTAGSRPRDWVFVTDVARACLAAGALPDAAPRVFNVCSGTIHGTHEVARLVERITDRRLVGDGEYEGPDAYGDPRPQGTLPRPEEGFAWRPVHNLETGLAEAWAWAQTEVGRRYLLSGAAS